MSSISQIRIATRNSALALWQARHVQRQLRLLHPQLEVALLPLTSRGDQLLDVPLYKVGGKDLFVKELEQALLDGRADIAVHSMKDVPMSFPTGLHLTAICQREDPRDAFVSNHYPNLEQLPQGAVVGTSSLRRQCQLLAVRPDLEVRFLRGNVNTRLAKLDAGEYDAIILAAAGLLRLQMRERIAALLAPEMMLPAAGQGALGIECRRHDAVESLLAPLHHGATSQCVDAERALVRRLNGNCQVPIGSYAELRGEQIHLRALVGTVDGGTLLRASRSGAVAAAEELGTALSEELLDAGAAEILSAL